MPITHNDLWEKFIDFENLYNAYATARSGGHREDMQVMRFTYDLEANLINLQNHLIWGTWKPDPVYTFVVYEPKKRVIHAPSFRDRIVHHALYQVVGKLFENKMITHTYACIEDRGPLLAALQMKEYLQSYPGDERVYVGKCDVSQYFPSISHDYIKSQIRRTICDKRLLYIMDTLIEQNEMDQGLYIGSLPSQLYAGINLTPLDHRMKDDLGVKHYTRYMDDFNYMSNKLSYVQDLITESERALAVAGLQMNPKSKIIPVTHGIDFCGYRIFRDYMLPRKRNVKAARKRILESIELYDQGEIELPVVRGHIMNFLGYMKHCNGYTTTEKILDEALVKGRPFIEKKEVI